MSLQNFTELTTFKVKFDPQVSEDIRISFVDPKQVEALKYMYIVFVPCSFNFQTSVQRYLIRRVRSSQHIMRQPKNEKEMA